jgi:16S rRNA (cytidine1402-2'-O)-methyltransferase
VKWFQEDSCPLSTLYVVATPIGNLGDLSPRALEVLGEVDCVAAEDTRRTGQLLSLIGISASLIPFHAHNEDASDLLSRLRAGENIALVSDAGTPLISDPGFPLVRSCLEQGIQVVPVPGASSVTAALSVAGIPTNRFAFEGFVPSKAKARTDFYAALAGEARTLVFFETPHRIVESMRALSDVMGSDRVVTLCRELTKTFEQIVSGPLRQIVALLEAGEIPTKGEFVVVVSGSETSTFQDADTLLKELLVELSPSRAAAVAARLTDLSKKALYDRAMQLKDESA